MTQVVYGQKGYLGSSMSVRAAEAYEQGETRCKKDLRR